MTYLIRIWLLCWWGLLTLPATAQQDFSWWNDLAGWDGVTTWEQYLTIAPATLGPNALPVPQFLTGRMDTTAYVGLAGVCHHHTGDPTENLALDVFTPLFSNRVALALSWVPYERYHFTETIRNERLARNFTGEGNTIGDIYIATLIQLLPPGKKGFEAMLRITLKTASGDDLGSARYTDSAGYSFDLSFGKDFPLNQGSSALRPYLMGGFYVWQTFDIQNLQNDAISFAAGLEWRSPKWIVNAGFGGYSGYQNNGDQPLVSRLSLMTNRSGRLQYQVGWQHGWRDFGYSSFSFGGRYSFSKGAGF